MKTREGQQEQTVFVVELGARLGHGTEGMVALLKRRGVEIQTDWAGRFVVPDAVARELVEAQRREAEASARAYSEWEAYRLARQVERGEVERVAFEAAVSEEQAGLLAKMATMNPGVSVSGPLLSLDSESQHRAWAKAQAVLDRWERDNPAATLSDFRP